MNTSNIQTEGLSTENCDIPNSPLTKLSTEDEWEAKVKANTNCRQPIAYTGVPIKDARFSKLKNIPDLLSDDKEGKIEENID